MDSNNQVRVESLEVLENLALRLSTTSMRLDDLCDQALRESQERLEAANAAFEAAISSAESAAADVASCEADVAECQESADSSDDGDDGGNDDLNNALASLDAARNELALAQGKLEEARQTREAAMEAHEATTTAVLRTREHLESNLGAGVALLNQKIGELREYLLGNPQLAIGSTVAAANYGRAWLGWNPPTGTVINQPTLARRFSLPDAALSDLARRWSREDPSLTRQIATLRERYARAATPEEREAVRMASRRGASGRLGELLAENALRPMARSLETQRRTTTGDAAAQVTITDIVLRGLHAPVRVGRLEIPAGSDASAEIKCGGPSYLKQQLTHMERQVAGHHAEHASFCFLSRDFRKLDRESKREIARTLGKNRSKIYAILPEKNTLDSLVWGQVANP